MTRHRTLVLDVVGLSGMLLADAPELSAFARAGTQAPLRTVTPAVTCSAQATMLTGLPVAEHGIVGNGWYHRDTAEVRFWCQSNALIQGQQVWHAAARRDPDFRGANLFWWFNMYSPAHIGVTPRPMYPADGRKIPDIYTCPPELREQLVAQLGSFPLFQFWGPATSIVSSQWIAACTTYVLRERSPDLAMVYLPHLDYDGQRFGPHAAQTKRAVAEVDALCGELIANAKALDYRVIVLSEYGLTPVVDAIPINRVLRRSGLLQVRTELGRELLDAGASDAFAVADHQVAHIYVRRPELVEDVRRLVTDLDGVERVFARGEIDHPADHARAGELLAISAADRWFSYYYWLDDERAPDFARCVDIHRKPGYDPVELFVDPALWFPKLRIARKLAAKKLGFRQLMDVIPLQPKLVRGSHGRVTDRLEDGPVLLGSHPELLPDGPIEATAVKSIMLDHVFGPVAHRRR